MTALQADDVPKFPSLDPGVTLLTGEGRTTGALQSLVLDHVLLSEGTALWVDAADNAATTGLAKIAPSRRTLDRIRVGRAFTAFQHYSLVDDLSAVTNDETPLVVAPSIEWFYANDDLRTGEGEAMLEAALASLHEIASTHDIPVLISKHAGSGFDGVIEAACDARLECVQTSFGPRFTGTDFETLVFECPGGVQTTLAFWRRLLEQRHSLQASSEPTEVASVGSY